MLNKGVFFDTATQWRPLFEHVESV